MTGILRREILIGLRRGVPYILLMTNALLLAGVAATVGTVSSSVSPWVAPPIGATSEVVPTGLVPTLIAWRGPTLFFILTAWLALIATVVGPMVGARMLTYERRAGTLDGLVASGVSPLALATGKLLAASLQVGLILLSAAPAFALVWLFGGVGERTVIAAGIFLGGYVVFLAAFGLVAGALAGGDLLPSAIAVLAATLLLLGSLVGLLALAAAGRPAGAAAMAMLNPLVDLLLTNPALAEAVTVQLPRGLPLNPGSSTDVAGRAITVSLPVASGLAYGALGLAMMPIVAAAVDPYHRLKTAHLRRAAARSA